MKKYHTDREIMLSVRCKAFSKLVCPEALFLSKYNPKVVVDVGSYFVLVECVWNIMATKNEWKKWVLTTTLKINEAWYPNYMLVTIFILLPPF